MKNKKQGFPYYIDKNGKSHDLELWLYGDFLPKEIKKKLIGSVEKKEKNGEIPKTKNTN